LRNPGGDKDETGGALLRRRPIGFVAAIGAITVGAAVVLAWIDYRGRVADEYVLWKVDRTASALRCAFAVRGAAPGSLDDMTEAITAGTLPAGSTACSDYVHYRNPDYQEDLDWLRSSLSSVENVVEYLRLDEKHVQLCTVYERPASKPGNMQREITGCTSHLEEDFAKPRPRGGRYCYDMDLSISPKTEDTFVICQ
jgi:hypothetical protein